MVAQNSRCSQPAAVQAGQHRTAAVLLLWCLITFATHTEAALPPCRSQFAEGEALVRFDCVWQEQQLIPAKQVVLEAPRDVGDLPALTLSHDAEPGTAAGEQKFRVSW